jgi:hypothetical protein
VELRYQLHTRGIDLFEFPGLLSRAFPALSLRLATLYLDDREVEVFQAVRGRLRRWLMPAARREAHWERARRKLGLSGDDVYDDDDAEHYAENEMIDEALDHWDPASARNRGHRR